MKNNLKKIISTFVITFFNLIWTVGINILTGALLV